MYLDASKFIASDELQIHDPVTQVIVNAKKAKASDNKLDWEEAETIYSDRGLLPDNVKTLQSSISVDSDAVTVDESGGLQTGGATTPTDEQRDQVARWIEALDMRLNPGTVTIDAADIDPAVHPELFRCYPPPPIAFGASKFSALTASDGRPSFSGVWLAIGGTITFQWKEQRPVLRHGLTLITVPHTAAQTTWSDMQPWTVTWDMAALTLDELGMISRFTEQTTENEEQ